MEKGYTGLVMMGLTVSLLSLVYIFGELNDEKDDKSKEPIIVEVDEATEDLTNPHSISTEREFETDKYKLEIISFEKFTSGDVYQQPRDGYEFVEIVVEVDNLTHTDYTVSSILCFSASVDGEDVGLSFNSKEGTKYKLLDGEVTKGKPIIGELTYEVPIGWREFILDVNIDYTDDSEPRILFTNKESYE